MAPTVQESQELADRQHSVVLIEDRGHRPSQKIENGDSMFSAFGPSKTLPSSIVLIAWDHPQAIVLLLVHQGGSPIGSHLALKA